MAVDAKTMSWWDTARLQVFVTVPAFLLGLVTANRFFVGLLARVDWGRRTARFLADLRDKYRSDRLWTRFPLARTLLVLDRAGIDAVLDSDRNAADPPIKNEALSKFIPDALTISSGDAWFNRRPFNEAVLGFGVPHRHREAFKDIVFREVDQLTAGHGELSWADFQALGLRVSQQILLGSGLVRPAMAAQLAQMASRSNWPFLPRQQRCFAAFYDEVERQLAAHRSTGDAVSTACLMHDSAQLLEAGRGDSMTRVPTQIGFWFFVLKDVVELHVARTLALIAAHDDVQQRVRGVIGQAPTLSADAIDGLHDLEACLVEQLRLWTPVPILLRRARQSFPLIDGISLEDRDQILMHAGFYHRDPRVFGASADEFAPGGRGDGSPKVYVFSGGRQSCAGQFLARFVLKAALARLLQKFRVGLAGPPIARGAIPYLYDHFKIRLRLLDGAAPQGAPLPP